MKSESCAIQYFLIIFMLFAFAFISYIFFRPSEKNIARNFTNTEYKKGRPLVIVFGATSKLSEKLLEFLLEKNFNVICASRRNSRWVKMTEGNEKLNKNSFIWVKCDSRLDKDVQRVFLLAKKWSKNSSIDVVINMALIKVNNDLLKCPFQTQKNDDDVVIRLTGAYNREYEYFGKLHRPKGMGNEHGFLTNVFGTINIVRLSFEFGAKTIIIPKNNFVDESWFDTKNFENQKIKTADINDTEGLQNAAFDGINF